MKLYDYEVDSYMGVEPSSIGELDMRNKLLRENLEQRSARGWRFVSSMVTGKSVSLIFEREAQDLEWKSVGISDWTDDSFDPRPFLQEHIDAGWFEHASTGTTVTFFRKKKK